MNPSTASHRSYWWRVNGNLLQNILYAAKIPASFVYVNILFAKLVPPAGKRYHFWEFLEAGHSVQVVLYYDISMYNLYINK